MDPAFLRAMADFLENPEEVTLQAGQAKDRLFKLADKFDQEKPRVNNEDMSALVYGIVVALASPLEILEQMDGLQLIVQMAHWLGKKEGRR